MYQLMFILYFVALCLHGLAIFCLCKHKKQNKNQKVLLINLSATEIIILLFKASYIGLQTVMHKNQTKTDHKADLFSMISFYLYVLATFLLLFAMFLIIVDRFLCIHLHVRYSYVVTKIRLMKVIIAAWIVSTIIGLPIMFLEDLSKEYYLILAVLNIVYITMATVVYGIICLHLKRRRKRLQTKSKMENSVTNSKQFVVPFLIVITFIIFASLPQCINVWLSVTNGETINVRIITEILLVCGFIVDPLIYVFFNKSLRDVALHYLRCKRFPLTASNNSTVLRNIAVVKSNSLNQSAASSKV